MNVDKTGAYIATCRKKLGMSQKELADELNISNKTVSKWETGGGFPDISLLPALAQRLNTSVDGILSGEETETKSIEGKAGEEVISYLLVKRITRFKIQGIITIIAGVIGFILFLFIQYDETLSLALLVGSSFELIGLAIFIASSYTTKVEFDSYNRLQSGQRDFKELWKPFALAGIWIWNLLPISAIIYFSFALLPINYNSILLILIILIVYGLLGIILTRKILKQKGDGKC